MFQQELDFFIQNQNDLVKQYNGKFLAIKGAKVLGVYETLIEAYIETSKIHQPGTFMLQPCKPGPDAYTITISTLGLISC